ncbi:basic-leucine zipper transcription factor [Mucor lusitanicus]|uniref:Basic-leucine zipper transcription factor n=2 Tax=Mucor circinelloides f. lusitanicus TaxID=29924 RepID=A0A168HMN0_MUCCL|nr:basic-leucine zipper transcription factor [Mucor lusitanicus]OAC98970.1 basic-leucine zipper transcription factor [Mucor lusitanicus CBS 277.49]
MSISNKNDSIHTTTPAATWGLDSTTLDDWLENDLKQSSLFQCRKSTTTTTTKHNEDTHNTINSTNAMKCSLKNLLARDDETKIKQEEQEPSKEAIKSNVDNKPLPPHLIPIIKVYSLLNTIRQNEQLAKEKQYNKKRLYATPPPPSPVLSTISSNDANCNNSDFHHQDQPAPVLKKKRGNNRPPVDLVVKRQRNTDAARRSRLRKAVKMETLEKRVDVLKTDNERLRVKVAVLETEVTHATEKEQRNRQRVLELEAQLAIAHRQLVAEYK